MGQAKRNKDAIAAVIRRDLESYERPMTPEEEALNSAVSLLPVVPVERMPNDRLLWMRMKPRECHANARFMERNDPVAGRTKQILGWMVTPEMYVLHSIIQQEGVLLCVTPHIAGEGFAARFDFAPDPALEMILEPIVEGATEQKFRIERDGVSIMAHKEVRRDLPKLLELSQKVRDLLDQGVHPLEAVARVGQQLGPHG